MAAVRGLRILKTATTRNNLKGMQDLKHIVTGKIIIVIRKLIIVIQCFFAIFINYLNNNYEAPAYR